MTNEGNSNREPIDLAAIEEFWRRESAEMLERNRALAAAHRGRAAELARRRASCETIIAGCMDERTAFTKEALGLLPGEALVYASGGGKIEAAIFDRLFGPRLKEAAAAGKDSAVYFVTHKCADDPHKGCAAFANDVQAQVGYFTSLKRQLMETYPRTRTHVLMLDTTAYGLEAVDIDEDDARCARVLSAGGGLNDFRARETGHAGHGIYIGDAYRAWVNEHNKYFRLSAMNPDIAGNVGIALNVMGHHSCVDLATTPVVIHVDLPRYAERAASDAAAANIGSALERILDMPAVREKIEEGSLQIVRTETDAENWQGKLL